MEKASGPATPPRWRGPRIIRPIYAGIAERSMNTRFSNRSATAGQSGGMSTTEGLTMPIQQSRNWPRRSRRCLPPRRPLRPPPRAMNWLPSMPPQRAERRRRLPDSQLRAAKASIANRLPAATRSGSGRRRAPRPTAVPATPMPSAVCLRRLDEHAASARVRRRRPADRTNPSFPP